MMQHPKSFVPPVVVDNMLPVQLLHVLYVGQVNIKIYNKDDVLISDSFDRGTNSHNGTGARQPANVQPTQIKGANMPSRDIPLVSNMTIDATPFARNKCSGTLLPGTQAISFKQLIKLFNDAWLGCGYIVYTPAHVGPGKTV